MKIGKKIRNLRLEHDLTQEELALRCDLSTGFISLLERDLTSPSLDTLYDILGVLGISVADFFTSNVGDEFVFNKEDQITTVNENLGYSITWLIKDAQKRKMEAILAVLSGGSTLFDEEAHFGEEFGYVLEGKIQIELQNETKIVKKGSSFYYNSNVEHKITNPFKRKAIVLLVSTPPTF